MKILICPDSFKGTLSAKEAAAAIEKGIRRAFPDLITKKLPMADGGYGTLDVILNNKSYKIIKKKVRGPLGKEVTARYLRISENKAFIEMAEAAGLFLIPEGQRNPLNTTTYGVGELVLDALKKGFSELYIGMGGSCTNDGGIGMAQALGVRFLDEQDKEILFRKKEGYSGGSLEFLRKIDASGINPLINKGSFVIASDVNNPLTGKNGASYVYGPQKGATPEMTKKLDKYLKNYAEVIRRDLKIDIESVPGAGAAGGLGAGLMAFLDARYASGVEIVMRLMEFENHLEGTDIIITGEGKIDGQTAKGKTISGIAKIAGIYGIPVLAIGGCLGDGYQEVYKIGVKLVADASDGRKHGMETLKKKAFLLLEAASEKTIRKFIGKR